MAISPTVLIVDDSEVQREYMAAMCRDNGAGEITLAADGNEALRILEINKVGFDVLICDLEMPDLDGIELIHILGEQKSKSGLVIVSGHEKSLITAAKVMAQDEGLRVLGTMQKPIPEKRLRAIFRLLKMCKIADSMAQNSPQRTYVSLSTSEIKRALIDRQFVLHYQPKINMQDMTLSGVEALVRLQLDDGQLVSPNEFIPVCEKYELIDDLTYEVVRLALAQSQRWCSLGQKINISINISAASFENADFCNNIMHLVRKSSTEAKYLTFEVTETSVVKNLGRALSILARLKLFGCKLSIDDYGTGYSSVKQLSNIPFDELKVDRTLIDGIARNEQLQVIFESTLAMCNRLGLKVVAEGIEKRSDWDYLTAKGCHISQGFFISKPMSEEGFVQWFKTECSQ